MSAPDRSKILRNTGRLIANPTTTTAPNYGGTELGSVIGVEFDYGIRSVRQRFDELGRTGEVWQFQDDAILAVRLREWAPDVLDAIFAGRLSAPNDDVVGKYDGRLSGSHALKVLFVPLDTTNGIGIYLPNAVPEPIGTETANRFSVLFELGMVCNFVALPVSSSDLTSYKVGPVSKILA
jgi:hypothetical protein